MVQRLEPVIIEMEREREYVMVVGHQAVLRAIYGYFMAVPLKDIPRLELPLHTLIGKGGLGASWIYGSWVNYSCRAFCRKGFMKEAGCEPALNA